MSEYQSQPPCLTKPTNIDFSLNIAAGLLVSKPLIKPSPRLVAGMDILTSELLGSNSYLGRHPTNIIIHTHKKEETDLDENKPGLN